MSVIIVVSQYLKSHSVSILIVQIVREDCRYQPHVYESENWGY